MQISILFVDDEDHILKAINRLLRADGYVMHFATSGREALEILQKENIDIIVSDMRMPEMDGLSLIKEVKRLYPDIVRIILSGYSQPPTILAAINQGDIYRYVTKPWNPPEEFKSVLKEAAQYSLERRVSKFIKENLDALLEGVQSLQNYSDNLAEQGTDVDISLINAFAGKLTDLKSLQG